MRRSDLIGLNHKLTTWEIKELMTSGVLQIERLRSGKAVRTPHAVIRPIYPYSYMLWRELPHNESGVVASHFWFVHELSQIFEQPYGHIPLWEFEMVRTLTVFTTYPLDGLDRRHLLQDLQLVLGAGAEHVYPVELSLEALSNISLNVGVMGRLYATAVRYCLPRDMVMSCFAASPNVPFVMPGRVDQLAP